MAGEPRSDWYVRTGRELSEFFGLSYGHVLDSQWYKDSLPDKDPKLGFYLPTIVDRRYQQGLRNPANQQVEESSDIAKLRKAKLSEEARQKKRENDVAEKLLLLREDVDRYLTQWAVRFRTPLLRLSDKIASRVPGSMKASVKQEVENDVVAALKMVRDLKLEGKVVEDLILEEAARIQETRSPTAPPKKKKATRKSTRKKAKKRVKA